MKLFFTASLCICFLNSFAQSDSVKNKFTIGVFPTLILAPTPDIFYIEIPLKQKLSLELSGGVYNTPQSLFNTSVHHYGFTSRVGIKIYRNHLFYYEILFFYRKTQYLNRIYNDNGEYSILETRKTLDIGGNYTSQKTGDELKKVFAVEWLFGRKDFIGKKRHLVIDYFVGVGVRVKNRDISIDKIKTHYYQYTGPVPPFKVEISQVAPSVQCGIKFGYSF